MTTKLESRAATYSGPVLSIFRIVIGLLFAMHGTAKLFGWPGERGAVEMFSWPMWWAGVIELVAGLLIAVGLFTRIAAFIAAGQMAVAYFWRHWPPLEGESASFWPIENGGETAVMFCFAFLLLAAMGSGPWAVSRR